MSAQPRGTARTARARALYAPGDYAHLQLSREAARRAAHAGLAPSDVESYTDRWCHGDCHELALALHLRFGWPTWVFAHEEDGIPLHSGVVLPDGRLLDMRGARERAEMLATCAIFWGEGEITHGVPLEEMQDLACLMDFELVEDGVAGPQPSAAAREVLQDAYDAIGDALAVLVPAVADAMAVHATPVAADGPLSSPPPGRARRGAR